MNGASLEQVRQAWDALVVWLWQPAPYTRAPWAVVLGLLVGVLAIVAVSLIWGVPWARRWWVDETLGPDEDERGVSTVEMTLTEHLAELRDRLVRSVIAVAITTGLAAIFYRLWFNIAVAPVRGKGNCEPVTADTATIVDAGNAALIDSQKLCLQAITPTELIFAYFQVTLVVGLIVAMPVIAYQLWAYIAPGLTLKERRYVIAVVPGATLSFIVGVLFAYFALMPAALTFLFGFSGDVLIRPTVASYISFISRLLIAIGVIFQLPLAMFFLSKVNLINPRMLGGIRRYVVVVAFIISAIVTPTPDPLNQLLVAVPILVLYEVGVLLARVA
ncbi:MAG: twin-arginine translocase subunit TatC [Chloroflexota bacterium]